MKRFISTLFCIFMLTCATVLSIIAVSAQFWWQSESHVIGLWTCRWHDNSDCLDGDNPWSEHLLPLQILTVISCITSLFPSLLLVVTLVWIKRDKDVIISKWYKMLVITFNALSCVLHSISIYLSTAFHGKYSFKAAWVIYVCADIFAIIALPSVILTLVCQVTRAADRTDYYHHYADSWEQSYSYADMIHNNNSSSRESSVSRKSHNKTNKMADSSSEDNVLSNISLDDRDNCPILQWKDVHFDQ